jgi:hypothetical protein
MTFLERIVLLGKRRAWLTGFDTRTLLRCMRQYEQSWNSGAVLPDLPKRMKQRLFPLSIWAGLMVSLRDPSFFAAGVLLIVPGILITVYWLCLRLFNFVSRWMGA